MRRRAPDASGTGDRRYRQAEATALGNLGLVYRAMGEQAKAVEQYQQDLAILEAIGMPREAERARRHIAELQERM